MTRSIRTAAGYLVRFAVLWFVDALSLLFTSWILPCITLTAVTLANGTTADPLTVAVAAALLLTIVNFLIRPVVFAVARPLGWIALFVIGFFVNAAALWLTAWLMPGFTVDLVGSLMGGIFLAFFNSIITGILDVDQDGSIVLSASLILDMIRRLSGDTVFFSSDAKNRMQITYHTVKSKWIHTTGKKVSSAHLIDPNQVAYGRLTRRYSLCWQIFFAGPLARLIFRTIFKKQLQQ